MYRTAPSGEKNSRISEFKSSSAGQVEDGFMFKRCSGSGFNVSVTIWPSGSEPIIRNTVTGSVPDPNLKYFIKDLKKFLKKVQ
jgi:hypothetical protein